MSRPIEAIVVVCPKIGKVERVMEIITEVAAYVKREEPKTLQYLAYRQVKPSPDGTQDIFVLETYADRAALYQHLNDKKHVAWQKQLADEQLLRQPMEFRLVSGDVGYASKL